MKKIFLMIFGMLALLPVCGKNVETTAAYDPAEAIDAPEDYPVYVCDSENVYHWDAECKMMKCDVMETLWEYDAVDRGYEPCEHCVPIETTVAPEEDEPVYVIVCRGGDTYHFFEECPELEGCSNQTLVELEEAQDAGYSICETCIETEDPGDTVYVCDGENIYHWDDECEMMRCDVVEAMSEDEAAQRGYEPCEHCLPIVVIEEVSAEEEL